MVHFNNCIPRCINICSWVHFRQYISLKVINKKKYIYMDKYIFLYKYVLFLIIIGNWKMCKVWAERGTDEYLCEKLGRAFLSSKVFDRWILRSRTGNYASAYRPRRKWRHGATPITPLSVVSLIAFFSVCRKKLSACLLFPPWENRWQVPREKGCNIVRLYIAWFN